MHVTRAKLIALDRRPQPWSSIPVHLLAPSSQMRLYHRRPPPVNQEAASQEPSTQETTQETLPTTSDPNLPHLTPSQTVHITQISDKQITSRQATARGYVLFSNTRPWDLLREGQATHKGDVFSVARIAGIMAAKRTPDIIPLCHPGIGLTGVEVDVQLLGPDDNNSSSSSHGAMRITATVDCQGRTGVEMEAMTATMGAALTVYDMLKAVDKGMTISTVQLREKKGGKSGHWQRNP